MGFLWGAAWGVVGMVPRWLFGFNPDVPFPLVFGVLGFIAGFTFSGVLVVTEGRRTLDQMSLPRFAGWDAIGGFLLSALFTRVASLGLGDVLAIAPTFTVASALCASGTLVLARRAERRELSDTNGDRPKAELTDDQKRKLIS